MTVKEFYTTIGADYNEAVKRLMDDAFIMKLLGKFAKDQNFSNLVAGMKGGDYAQAFTASHTLKGIALNLGLDVLGRVSSDLTEALRAGENDKAKVLFPPVVAEYAKVDKALKELGV